MTNLNIDPKLIEKAAKALLSASKVGRPWDMLTIPQRHVYRNEAEAVIHAVFEELGLRKEHLEESRAGFTPEETGPPTHIRDVSDWKAIRP